MKPSRNVFVIIITLFLLLTICGWSIISYWSFLHTPLVASGESQVTFLFKPGTTVKKAAYSLKQRNLLKHPIYFVLLARLSGAEHDLKAGEYVIEPGTTPSQLIDKMVKGEALRHAFTIVEGWTFSQMISALNNNQYVTHTINKLSPEEIMAKIGHPGEWFEGMFAPDTYLFSGNIIDTEILANAYKLMQKNLANAWSNREHGVSYHCLNDALIVASLIEKETPIPKEKPIIAGIILRRLEKNMLLQIDPSVIYGLKQKYSGKLTRADLLKRTSYNTYVNKGLPPTPISMPGKDSIEAALHPESSDYWYYVSKGDGSHKFSSTLTEQKKSIRRYLLQK